MSIHSINTSCFQVQVQGQYAQEAVKEAAQKRGVRPECGVSVTPPTDKPGTDKPWNERAIAQLNRFDALLDVALPDFPIQKTLDDLGHYIQTLFSPLEPFTKWLDSKNEGAWYQALASFLIKLPVRAAKNILYLLYKIIETAVTAPVHPLKTLNTLAKMLVALAHALSQPNTWSKMGAGAMGAASGQAVVSGNPLSLIALAVGASFVVGGISWGAIKAAVMAETGQRVQSAARAVFEQVKELPEALLTGFCMGLLIGGVQRIVQSNQPAQTESKPEVEAKPQTNPQTNPQNDYALMMLDREQQYIDIWNRLWKELAEAKAAGDTTTVLRLQQEIGKVGEALKWFRSWRNE